MTSLSRYTFVQTAGPLIAFTAALTGLVWLTQSLRMLDLVINQGQNAGTFLYLTILVLPSLLAVILPIALFIAVLYVFYRFYIDSELVVMWASGVGRWQIAAPVVAIAVLTALALYLVNLVLMPAGMRTMKDRVFDIRGDAAALLLREGQFTTPGKGLTVFLRESGGPGAEIRGILVHDARDPEQPQTYLAERGFLAQTSRGPILVMENGSIQTRRAGSRSVTIGAFDKYTFDVSTFVQDRATPVRESSERYLHELFGAAGEPGVSERQAHIFAAEGHARLSSPLYAVTFALIAMAAAMAGSYAKRGFGMRVAIAMGAILAVRFAGFGAQSAAAENPAAAALLYIVPVAGAALAAAVLSGWEPWTAWRKPAPRPEAA